MDREAWRAVVHGVAKSRTWLSDWTELNDVYTEYDLCVYRPLSRVWLFATPWTTVHHTPLSMVFPKQEYWSGLPFPSPGGLPNPGIEPRSPELQAVALPSKLWGIST